MSKVTKINREEFKTLVAQRSGLSKEKTDIFLDALTSIVKETMVEDKVPTFKPSQVLKSQLMRYKMNKYLEDIFFDDMDDLVAHVMEKIYDKDEIFSISIVAKFNDAQEIIRAILADEDIRISDIDICSPDFSGYDAEYCLGILADDGVIEFSCAPAISDGYYLDNEADEVYIIENCSSGIFRHCEADEGYLVIVGESDECECACCECCKEGVEIMCDENGNAHGFTASKTEDDDTVYKSITYYTSNDLTKDEVREILKGYGF